MLEYNKINVIQIIKTIIFFAFMISLIFFFYHVPRLSIPLALTLVIEVVLRPFIPKFERLGLSKSWTLIIIIIGFLCLVILPFIKIIPIVKSEIDNIEYYIPQGEEILRKYYFKISVEVKRYTNFELGDQYLVQILDFGKTITKWFLFNLPNMLAQFFEWLFLIPFFLFFLIRDSLSFKAFFLKLIPNIIFEQTYYLFHQFHRNLGSYIFVKMLEASIVGGLTTIGLMLLNIRFPFILGPFAAVTNIVPYIGPILGPIPGIIVALTDHGTDTRFWGVVFLYIITNVIDMAIVFPILVSKIVDLHPLIVVVSVVLGHQYAGIAGMVVSIPVAAIVKLIIYEILGNTRK